MPRVTKEMLEEQIRYLHVGLRERDHKIELLKKELQTIKSSFSMIGQTSAMVIAMERLGDALAHTLGNPAIREMRKERHDGAPGTLKVPF